jgi:sugar O-acyltransferase (sialic acid O-acetyltransferase NeuD family)
MNRQIAIIGAGGLGREVLSLIRALPEWECIGFFDDGKPKGSYVGGLPILGHLSDIAPSSQISLVIAVGSPDVKQRILQQLPTGLLFPSLVHPRALIQDPSSVVLGPGVVIGAGSVLTTAIRIGAHTLVNLNCTIGHDVSVGVGCSLMPGAHVAGSVVIEDYVLVGSGANILNGLSIGTAARIGAGAVVTKAVLANNTMVGIPAKAIQP